MSVVAQPPVRVPASPVEQTPHEDAGQGVEAPSFSSHEIRRWALILLAPFILGAAFFGLAIGLDEEWPITPAFLLGPFVMIAGYIYLSLTSDANTE